MRQNTATREFRFKKLNQNMSQQENLDAATALLRNFLAQQHQQQHHQQQPPPAGREDAAAAALQHLFATQQQQLLQRRHHSDSTLPPQAYQQPFDPNMALLLTDVINNNMTAQSPPPTAAVLQQQQQQQHNLQLQQQKSLIDSVQLLGSLNPSLAQATLALMSNALQPQSSFSSSQDGGGSLITSERNNSHSDSSSFSELIGVGSRTTNAMNAPIPSTTVGTASSSPHFAGAMPILSAAPGGVTTLLPQQQQQQQQQQQHRPDIKTHPLTKMQKWSLLQLESHAMEFKDGGYEVPPVVSLLLIDARKKEAKRHAKRIANRRSANASRERKKAEIDRLANDNARLRRQEIILSYLPDPVIVISPRGIITFCSRQVERKFRHKIGELEGAKIEDLMIPRSRVVIKKLIRDTIADEEVSDPSDNGGDYEAKKGIVGAGNETVNKSSEDGISGRESGGYRQNGSSESESAFPLLEVKLNSKDFDAGEDDSDSDETRRLRSQNGKKSFQACATELSSLTHKDSSLNSDEGVSDESNSFEKEKRSADTNLSNNVEACKHYNDKAKTEQVRFSHKDDVMGASVTANNADAKLSSLMHEPSLKTKYVRGPKVTADKPGDRSSSTMDSSLSKTSDEKAQGKESSTSEDSERESGESPEDSNSSSSGMSYEGALKEKGNRVRPIAPSRNVCVIRGDLTTIWCELTASIRTSEMQDDIEVVSVSKDGSAEEEPGAGELEKELLLCFRPIQEGDEVSPDLRFRPSIVSQQKQYDGSDSSNPKTPGVTESSGSGSNGEGANATSTSKPSVDLSSTETQMDVDTSYSMQLIKTQSKKRPFQVKESGESNKKSRPSDDVEVGVGQEALL